MEQTTSSCQLCNNPRIMKWKCEDCILSMCDDCKQNIHSKFKFSEAHRIISISNTEILRIEDRPEQFDVLKLSTTVSSYTTPLRSVTKLLYFASDIVYFLCNPTFRAHTFLKCKLYRTSIEILNDFRGVDLNCMDFALTNDGGILFSPLPGNEMKLISSTGNVMTVEINQERLKILAIHLSKNKKLLIGTREEGPRFPVLDVSKRQVLVYTVSGTNYEREQTIEKLFSYARRITTDSSNVVYVNDVLSYDNTGRVVAVDRRDGVKFIYTGVASNVYAAITSFKPRDIVITQNDNILVSDMENHLLHALNRKGELIGLLNVAIIGIQLPHSLCIDDGGLLLIGCDASENDTENAKIHVVRILV